MTNSNNLRCAQRFSGAAAAAILLSVPVIHAVEPAHDVYFAHGWHGGYYFTAEEASQDAWDKLFELLAKHPGYKALLEIEPYTLERMQHGEKFACERRGRDEARMPGWSFGSRAKGWRTERLRDAGHSGFGIRLNVSEGDWAVCLQKLPAMELRGHPLVFSGRVRVRRGVGAHLYCNAWGHDAAGLDTMLPGSERRSEPIPADGQWHDLRLELTVPSQAVWLFPQAKTTLPPTEADFDDLSLRDARTGRELLRNGGFEEMAVPTLKDTARLARLREFVRAGRAEIVGGAYTQPILYAIGDEPAVRQFTYGCRAVEESLGVPVKFYATQERTGGVPGLAEEVSQPLLVSADSLLSGQGFSKLTITPSGCAVLTAVYRDGDDWLLRLWRQASVGGEIALSVPGASALWATDLRGRPMRKLADGDAAKLSLRASADNHPCLVHKQDAMTDLKLVLDVLPGTFGSVPASERRRDF